MPLQTSWLAFCVGTVRLGKATRMPSRRIILVSAHVVTSVGMVLLFGSFCMQDAEKRYPVGFTGAVMVLAGMSVLMPLTSMPAPRGIIIGSFILMQIALVLLLCSAGIKAEDERHAVWYTAGGFVIAGLLVWGWYNNTED